MVYHEINPVFFEDSRILILGSFPSPKSREIGFYYGHPQNRFWKIMSGLFCEEIGEDKTQKIDFLKRNKIALWDVIASCDIVGAGDNTITNALPNDIPEILRATKIRHVFTTGKTAGALYQKFFNEKCDILPSPSPANCAVPLSKLLEAYSVILPYVKEDLG